MALWLWIPLVMLAWMIVSLGVAMAVGRALREEQVDDDSTAAFVQAA